MKLHTCAIHDGAAKCWGANNFGQLGDDSQTDRATPTQVIGLSAGVTAIATGDNHSCAVQNGEAKCWGRNQAGQLGNNNQLDSDRPVRVEGLTANVTVISAAGGSGEDIQISRSAQGHSCAIHQGFAKCWGSNYRGQLGNGEGSITDPTVDRSSPVYVLDAPVLEPPTQLRSVAVTENSIEVRWNPPANNGVRLIESYVVYWTAFDQMREFSKTVDVSTTSYVITGLDVKTSYRITVAATNLVGPGVRSIPLVARTLGLAGAQAITAGARFHGCVVYNDAVWCWGDGSFGRTGRRASGGTAPGLVLDLDTGVTAIAAGANHTCAIQDAAAKCWGFGGSLCRIRQRQPRCEYYASTSARSQ